MKLNLIYSKEGLDVDDVPTSSTLSPALDEEEMNIDDIEEVSPEIQPIEDVENDELMAAAESLNDLQQMINRNRTELTSNSAALEFANYAYAKAISRVDIRQPISLESIQDVASLEASIMESLKDIWQSTKSFFENIIKWLPMTRPTVLKESRELSNEIQGKIKYLKSNPGEYEFISMVDKDNVIRTAKVTEDFIRRSGNYLLKSVQDFNNMMKNKDFKSSWDAESYAKKLCDDVERALDGLPIVAKPSGSKNYYTYGDFTFGLYLHQPNTVVGKCLYIYDQPDQDTFKHSASSEELIKCLKELEHLAMLPIDTIASPKYQNEMKTAVLLVDGIVQQYRESDEEFVKSFLTGANYLRTICKLPWGWGAHQGSRFAIKLLLDSIKPVTK